MSDRAGALPKIIGIVACLMSVGTVTAHTQPVEKIPRIGFLSEASLVNSPRVPYFLQGLRDLGYVEGRNIAIDWRFADGRPERVPALAADLVRRKVAVIVCPGATAGAAIKATSTIPIVVAVATNFVSRGWAKSLRQPGSNVTGQSTFAADLSSKQLELLKETVPGLSRVAILAVVGNRGHAEEIRRAKKAATKLGLGLVAIRIKEAADLPAAFRRMQAEHVNAIIVLRHGLLVHLRRQVADLARAAALPTMFGHFVEAEAGGLMAYGADTDALYRGAASYVDRILKGADPAELPISRASKFLLTVNLKTARALGITFPRSILLSADKVIE